jgi:hypothetical protein
VPAYLLSPAHCRNGGKARFFEARGFAADQADRHGYEDGKAFEVEFPTLDGNTAAVATGESS